MTMRTCERVGNSNRGDTVRLLTRGILAVLVLMAPLGGALADTGVGGLIDTDTTWDQDGSPYLVQEDLTVGPGATLTIDPGVVVRFEGAYAFRVQGVLHAVGAVPPHGEEERVSPDEVEWILFTQDSTGFVDENGDPLPEEQWRWKGIRFDGSPPASVLRWVIVEGGWARGEWPENNGGGIFVRGTSPTVENCIVRRNKADQFGGGVYLWSSSASFRNNLLLENYAEVAGGGLYLDLTQVELHNLTVVGNEAGGINSGNGVFFGPGANPLLRSCILWENGHGTFDEGYHNDGVSTVTEPEARNCIISSLQGDDAENNLLDDGAYFQETEWYTLADSSEGVDFGVSNDPNVANEPIPNGGRINCGAYGGTPLAQKSVPVARPSDSRRRSMLVAFGRTRLNNTTAAQAFVENIGHARLQVHPDSISWIQRTPPEDRFTVVPFQPFFIKPDSIGGIRLEYTAVNTDTVNDTLRLGTDGGPVVWVIRGTPVNPLISISTEELDFDTVEVVDPKTMTFDITNVGTTPLVVGQVVAGVGEFGPQFDTDFPGDVTVQPSETYTVNITCAPTITGAMFDSVRIDNTDRTLFVHVRAFAHGPAPVVIPDPGEQDTLDFEFVDINPDSSHTLTVTFFNEGNDDLVVDSAVVGIDSVFSTNVPEGGVTVPPRGTAEADSFEVRITFNPVSLDDFEDALTIYTNAASYTFTLIGRGVTGGTYFDGEIPRARVPSVWGAGNDSIYVCAGNTLIPAGSSITILPGVKVYFEDAYYLRIEGKLEVLGSEEAPVRFAPLTPGEPHGGLRFVASDPETRLEWAVIDSGTTQDVSSGNGQPSFEANGGGIAVFNCNPSFYRVTVRNCYSHNEGGGIWVFQGAPSFLRCTVEDNRAEGDGGGLFFWGGMPEVIGTTVRGNEAGGRGGGMYVRSFSEPLIANSLLRENHAADLGGGLYLSDYSGPVMLNDVLYANAADNGSHALFAAARSVPILRNSVVWGHDPGGFGFSEAGELVARYSLLEEVAPEYDHPSLLDASDPEWDPGDPQWPFAPLTDGSPLVDGGDPASQYGDVSFPPSLGGMTADVGLYGGPYAGIWGAAPLRLTFFRNTTNPRAVKMVVNALEELAGEPTLTIEDYTGSETAALAQVASGVWSCNYLVNESRFITVTVSAPADDGQGGTRTVSFRRSLSIAVYSPETGAVLSGPGGAGLVLPPGAVSGEMLIFARSDWAATLPDGVPAARMGARWRVDAPVAGWRIPGEVILPCDAAALSAGGRHGVAVWRHDEGGWTRLESYLDPAGERVHAMTDGPGVFVVLAADEGGGARLLPSATTLGANYPNPFNPTTVIPFTLARAGRVDLRLYNLLGREVAVLAGGLHTAGPQSVLWNGRDDRGRELASGVYFYRLRTRPADGSAGVVLTRKLVLVR